MIPDDRIAENLDRHVRILGTCWIIYGFLRLVAAVWLVTFSGTATVMFGALLNRVPNPFSMMTFFHVFYAFLVALSVVCGVLGILGGWTLLAGRRSGRVLTLAAGFLSLSEIPLGLMLGTYTLVVLLPLPASYAPPLSLTDRSSGLRHHPSAT